MLQIPSLLSVGKLEPHWKYIFELSFLKYISKLFSESVDENFILQSSPKLLNVIEISFEEELFSI